MLKTAENVTMGHPDKVCDQISDAILDACLEQDQNSRVAVETMGGHGKLFILGEVSTEAEFDAPAIAQKLYQEIGYKDLLDIQVKIVRQSPDISKGVDTGGAGDQGIMVGYATCETPELLPLEHVLATRLIRRLEAVRQDASFTLSKYLLPDGKAQVTLNGKEIETVVLSTQHKDSIGLEDLRQLIIKEVIKPIIPIYKQAFINPAGSWHLGGFNADTGLTGRKITADNYGPQIPVGGGCFSGKDPSKVDRSAAYMARYLAVEYLKNLGAQEVLVKLAYAIGKREPVMATAEVDGQILEITGIDLSPRAIIDFLKLREPQYKLRARYGFFHEF
jgi:S-adenosylmethionine synthetase